jgi:hypothetical protein
VVHAGLMALRPSAEVHARLLAALPDEALHNGANLEQAHTPAAQQPS